MIVIAMVILTVILFNSSAKIRGKQSLATFYFQRFTQLFEASDPCINQWLWSIHGCTTKLTNRKLL